MDQVGDVSLAVARLRRHEHDDRMRLSHRTSGPRREDDVDQHPAALIARQQQCSDVLFSTPAPPRQS
jgi:hypothetical protein